MQLNRILFLFTITLIFIFSACQASEPEKEKMIFVTAGDHFQLGVIVSDLSEKQQKDTGVEEGAYIIDVIEDTEAEGIGLQQGDVIIKFDGKEIKSADDLHDLIREIKEEKEIQLTIKRDKKDINLKAKLRKADVDEKIELQIDDEDLLLDIGELPLGEHFKFFSDDSPNKGGFLGVNAKNVSESMLEYFEVEHGVLIEDVIKDAPAEKAGLKAGDVITKINDRDIKDYRDLVRTLNFYNPGEKVTVYYSRKGSKKNVSVTLAEKEKREPRMKRIIKRKVDDGPMRWFEKDSDNVKSRKRIHRVPDRMFDKTLPRLRFMVI